MVGGLGRDLRLGLADLLVEGLKLSPVLPDTLCPDGKLQAHLIVDVLRCVQFVGDFGIKACDLRVKARNLAAELGCVSHAEGRVESGQMIALLHNISETPPGSTLLPA